MLSRSKVLLAFGAACLSTAVLASGAMAHDKHREKLGEISGKNSTALKVEVRGLITALTAPTAAVPGPPTTPAGPGSITISAGTLPGLTWTCAIAPGTDVSSFSTIAPNNRVKAKCRSAEGTGLTLTKLRHKDHGDKVKVEARGVVTAIGAASISVQPGTGLPVLPAVVCVIGPNTKIKGTPPVIGDTVKVECKSKSGAALTAKKIEKKVVKVEAKGLLTIDTVAGTVTVGTVVCSIPAGTTVDPTLAGKFVEIKCLGTPPVLAKIELEDEDDD